MFADHFNIEICDADQISKYEVIKTHVCSPQKSGWELEHNATLKTCISIQDPLPHKTW